jgi:hypothetical protein
VRKGWLPSVLVLGAVLVFGCGRERGQAGEKSPEQPAFPAPLHDYAMTISIEELKEHAEYLASDDLEGRRSGTPGGAEAAEYLSSRFRELGLRSGGAEDGSYLQRFPMAIKKQTACYLKSEHGRVDNWEDFMELHSGFSGERDIELVFAGYGRDSDFEGKNVEGKLVAFLQGTPERNKVSNDFERMKIERALKNGAAGTLLVVCDDPPFLDYVHKLKPYFLKERHYLFSSPDEALASKRRLSISPAGTARLFGRNPAGRDVVEASGQDAVEPSRLPAVKLRMVTTYEETGQIQGANVLGYLEGTSESRECVVLTAHYDHLGKVGSKIFYGAYDNAAGVAALLEIADAFASAARDGHKPVKSIVFLAPDAEELGGLGSRFYLEHPIFPLSSTLADINIDGIGREDAERPRLKDFVHLYLSSNGRADLRTIQNRVLESTSKSLRIEPRENYAGSDHAIFEERLIPAVAFSTGHPKDHHQPTDTPDKLDYRNIRDIARLAFAMAWEIAFSEKAIERIVSE